MHLAEPADVSGGGEEIALWPVNLAHCAG
jgi:hypothetical protein